MSIAACIIGTCDVDWWGLSSRTRLTRQLRALGIGELPDDPPQATTADHVLRAHAAYLVDSATLGYVLEQPELALLSPVDGRAVAALAPTDERARYAASLDQGTALPPRARPRTPDALERYDEALRQAVRGMIEPISAARRDALESLLYGNAYKGITDLVTKWWWPRPARRLVGWCARAGITPNQVTITGCVLMLAACVLFWHGQYLVGLACGWIMTLLDTVDGKLARVTVQSSRFGHALDHGMDIVHPPFWYVLWGRGLGADAVAGWPLAVLDWTLVAAYLGGRAVEGVFPVLGRCSVFAWRPFDAYARLVTARRNPCLIILTVATLAGAPAWGYLGVVGGACSAPCCSSCAWSRQRWCAWPDRRSLRGCTKRMPRPAIHALTALSPGPHGPMTEHDAASTTDSAPARFVQALRERHGAGVLAIVLYGSWLRGKRDTVLDFYVLLEDYSALGSRVAALANRLLPPNVYYLLLDHAGETQAAKYATVSLAQFERAITRGVHPYFWARFAQPCELLYVRDTATRTRLDAATVAARRHLLAAVRPLPAFLHQRIVDTGSP